MARLVSSGVNPKRFDRTQIKFYLYLIPIALVMLLPIVFIFNNAFKPLNELFAYPPQFFVKNPTLKNFKDLFALSSGTSIPAARFLFNSILSTFIVVISTVYISTAAGYTLSKKQFLGKNFIFEVNSLALMFVPVAVAIPRFFVIKYTGLIDSFAANIIPLIAMPVGLFLVKQFIDQIPNAIIEAAQIDGASDYLILCKIIIPVIKPALSTVAILSFQSAWNAVEASQLFIDRTSLKSFAFYMSTISNTGTVAGAGVGAAASLIMLLPNLILFTVLQSGVIDTMAHSGIK